MIVNGSMKSNFENIDKDNPLLRLISLKHKIYSFSRKKVIACTFYVFFMSKFKLLVLKKKWKYEEIYVWFLKKVEIEKNRFKVNKLILYI